MKVTPVTPPAPQFVKADRPRTPPKTHLTIDDDTTLCGRNPIDHWEWEDAVEAQTVLQRDMCSTCIKKLTKT